MASVVEICNLALARLGDEATVASIDPPEGSAQAEHCQRFYPIARDVLMESHDWSFATARARLALLADADAWEWQFAYAEPANTIRVLAILGPNGSATDEPQDFDREATATATKILTNQADAVARYTVRVIDSSRYPPLFVDALAWLLASMLAKTVVKGEAGINLERGCMQQYMLKLSEAKVSDANQRRVQPKHTPGWIGAR